MARYPQVMDRFPHAPLEGAELDQFVNPIGFTRFLSAEPLDGYIWNDQWMAFEEGDKLFRTRIKRALTGSLQ